MMASRMAMPRQGRLDKLYHVFELFKKKHNSKMVFDPIDTDVGDAQFSKEDWNYTVYGECHEDLPPDAPQCRGFILKTRAFVEADNAGNYVTRRSRAGFIIYLNSAPIYWTSKNQTSIETIYFASEFITMKNCCEYICGIRYNLRVTVIPCDIRDYVYGDNQSVLVNSPKTFSMPKKKFSSIAFHFVHEGVAKDKWRVTYISIHDNVADIMTKSPNIEKRVKFMGMILNHIT